MAGHRSFNQLREKMSPERRAAVEKRVQRTLAEMRLQELRDSLDISQGVVGNALGIKQAAVSRLERRKDMHISTLRDYVTALGGELEILVHFPEGDVRLNQFSSDCDSAGSSTK
jgi:predicted transcriptional regulator